MSSRSLSSLFQRFEGDALVAILESEAIRYGQQSVLSRSESSARARCVAEDIAAFLETQEFIAAAFTEDDVLAAMPRGIR